MRRDYKSESSENQITGSVIRGMGLDVAWMTRKVLPDRISPVTFAMRAELIAGYMETNNIEIVTKDISPLWLKFIAVLIFVATNIKFVTLTFNEVNPLVFIIFNLIAFSIWTGREVVIIDLKNKMIKEGYKVLGILRTDKYQYTGIEKIFVNRVLTSQSFYRLATETRVHDEVYKAFLKTDDGEKFCIGEKRDKDELIKLLKGYNRSIKTIIIDNTTREPEIIEA